jgi:sterol 24-C-methyltransferase
MILASLELKEPTTSSLLDIGCGRGRVANHVASLTGGFVSGFNIDANQVNNAIAYAKETAYDHRTDFQIGDHHKVCKCTLTSPLLHLTN